MHHSSDSNGRRAEEYLLFALAFIGFGVAGSGVIVCSPAIACTGAILLLLALGCFLPGASAED
jgi:hypothetical protein